MKSAKLTSRSPRKGLSAAGVALVVAAVLPWLLGGNLYAYDLAVVAMVYGLFAVAWDVFCGSTGEYSFGHSLFIGVSAYAVALLQARLGLPPVAACLAGALVGALAGAVAGLLTIRHTAAVFAMVTMALQLTFHRSLFIWSNCFGGEEGVIVHSALLPHVQSWYVLTAGISVAVLALAVWVRGTHAGRLLRSSGGDTRVSMASGVPVPHVRVVGVAVSGLLAGLGGSILAVHHRLANHELAGDGLSGLILLLCLVGGAGTAIGPWLAAVLYVAILREALAPLGRFEPVLVFGVMFVFIWACPQGLGNLLRRFGRRHEAHG
jgi:branched-chain amino acid transport system permease protein